MAQTNKIKIRRGLNASIPAANTEVGELRYSTDTKEVFIDTGSVNQKIGGDPAGFPVSTAQQTALNLKQDASTAATDAELTAHTGSTANPHGVTKAQVGLANAENTTDLLKVVSTATQAALDTKQAIHEGAVALCTPNNLTSNTSNSDYTLTASSEHTVHLFYRIFDGNDANHWYTLGTTVATGTIELRYKIRPTNLLLKGETTLTEYWTRWQLLGSNDGTTWDILVDRSGVDEVIQTTSKNFTITTHKDYKRFRFNGLAAVGINIPLSRLEISGVEVPALQTGRIQVFADNAAAVAGGLLIDATYRSSDGLLRVRY